MKRYIINSNIDFIQNETSIRRNSIGVPGTYKIERKSEIIDYNDPSKYVVGKSLGRYNEIMEAKMSNVTVVTTNDALVAIFGAYEGKVVIYDLLAFETVKYDDIKRDNDETSTFYNKDTLEGDTHFITCRVNENGELEAMGDLIFVEDSTKHFYLDMDLEESTNENIIDDYGYYTTNDSINYTTFYFRPSLTKIFKIKDASGQYYDFSISLDNGNTYKNSTNKQYIDDRLSEYFEFTETREYKFKVNETDKILWLEVLC